LRCGQLEFKRQPDRRFSQHDLPIPCGRFAPSPTGLLHPGSLLAAFGSWLLARHHGGLWRLRIEDVDPPRTVPGAAESQLQALAAFGLAHDGPILWQSTRGEAYQAALDVLLASDQAFVCHCSRSDLAANGGIHHRCVARQPRPDPAVRFRVPRGSIVHFDDGLRGRSSRTCTPRSATSCCAVPTAAGPTSWPWWSMTPRRA
jgi:glutamyl-Q tRNA(Asp) synthetase